MRPAQKQSGNIVVYLLGAVALLGLLIVMVRGSSTPGSNIDAEQMTIKVSEVQQYGAELERAVQFILQNGYSETDIRFAHPDAHADYGDIDDDPGRQVFHRMGGGTTFRAPPSAIQTTPTPWVFTGRIVVPRVGTQCSSSSCTDLVAILPDVTREFCISINNKNNYSNPGGEPPVESAGGVHVEQHFVGTYTYSSALNLDEHPSRTEGCFEGSGSSAALTLPGHYYYYRVLLAR